MALWASLPTTQARVTFTLGAFALTAVRYTLGGVEFGVLKLSEWSPGLDWMGFIAVMAGLDWAQFRTKRMTDDNYVAAKADQPVEPRGTPPPDVTQ